MSEPFLAEVRIVGFNFPPRGWALCDGQILPINQNQSLYSLLGTTYGGDGRTSFALPDMRGRVPVHPDNAGIRLGTRTGEEIHALTPAEMPAHTHTVSATGNQATASNPENNVLASKARRATQLYATTGADVAMQAATVGNAGGGQGHNNMQPSIAVNYVIALQGLFPSRN